MDSLVVGTLQFASGSLVDSPVVVYKLVVECVLQTPLADSSAAGTPQFTLVSPISLSMNIVLPTYQKKKKMNIVLPPLPSDIADEVVELLPIFSRHSL